MGDGWRPGRRWREWRWPTSPVRLAISTPSIASRDANRHPSGDGSAEPVFEAAAAGTSAECSYRSKSAKRTNSAAGIRARSMRTILIWNPLWASALFMRLMTSA